MWKHIYTGAMGSMYMNLSLGLFLVAYGRSIGIGYRAFGILGGLSSFAVSLQLVGAHVSARLGARRPLWFACAMGERLARGLAIVAAYYLSGRSAVFTSLVFVALLSIGSAFGALATPSWFSWLADLVPADQQGRFWGRREAWVALATTVVLLPCALFYDWARTVGFAVPALLLVFALGMVLGFADLLIHNTIPEPPMGSARTSRIGSEIMTVLRDRGFRPWLAFACAWNFSMMLGASMCGIYFVDNLFAGSFTFAIVAIGIVPLAARMVTSSHTGAFVDRFGTRRVLIWSHLLWSLIPLPWLFARPENAVWILAVSNLVAMPAVGAAMNAGLKFVTRFPRREDRAMYWAVSDGLARAAGGVGAIAAGEVLEALKGVLPSSSGVAFSGFHVLFIVSISLRLLSVAFVRRLPALECEQVGSGSASGAAPSCA